MAGSVLIVGVGLGLSASLARLFHAEKKTICLQTLNSLFPPEDGSVQPQTLGKRVLDDPQHFTFRGQKKSERTFDILDDLRRPSAAPEACA